ncbi:MAG: SDR family oxidoreductase [Bacteroidales bacterium]
MKLGTYNPFSLENKTILIVGASSGIGRATAEECSKLGASIILSGRNKSNLDNVYNMLSKQGNHNILPADLLSMDDIHQMVDCIEKLDGLVLSAGIACTSPMQYSDTQSVNNVFAVNFNSQIELFRLLVKNKKLNKGASIVFVSSIGGVFSFGVGNAIYSASKGALNSFMKVSALELSSKGIRVNSVNPGMTNTNFIRNGAFSEEQLILDASNYPLKRYGNPEDIAYGIIYLLSNASSWVTGTTLVIDGGITIK